MSVFVATSKRFYPEAERVVARLRDAGFRVHHPYFHLDPAEVEADPDFKTRVTLQHFPEIDDADTLYAITPDGYAGCSVTIEMTYAYSKGKRVVVSEPPTEFALRALVSDVCPMDDVTAFLGA